MMSTAADRSMTQEPELIHRVPLCDGRGRLNRAAVGWSRRPIHELNLHGRWGRKKRWNYWCVSDGELLFSVTLSSLDYVGAAFAYLWHGPSGRFVEKTILRPFSQGCRLSNSVDGDLKFDDKRLSLSVARCGDRTTISVASADFGGAAIDVDVAVEHPRELETLNVVIPWSERAFQFTSKQHAMPASGTVRWGHDEFHFQPPRAFACLDFGRGVWPYRTRWNWGASSSRQAGHTVGLNLGGQWTDGTGMTENSVVVDGRLYKIADCVRFEHSADLMRPWSVRSVESDCVRLTFTPVFERVARSNLVVFASEVHQMLGHFTGSIRIDPDQTVALEPAFGWVEEHFARW